MPTRTGAILSVQPSSRNWWSFDGPIYCFRPGIFTEKFGGYFPSTSLYWVACCPNRIVTGRCRIPSNRSSLGLVDKLVTAAPPVSRTMAPLKPPRNGVSEFVNLFCGEARAYCANNTLPTGLTVVGMENHRLHVFRYLRSRKVEGLLRM